MLARRRKDHRWDPRPDQPNISRGAAGEPTPAVPAAQKSSGGSPDDLPAEIRPTVEIPAQPRPAGEDGHGNGPGNTEPVRQPATSWHDRPTAPVPVDGDMPAPGRHPLAGPLVEVCGGSCANTRGRENQDRWLVGAGPAGAWLIVADGISGGPHGARAAQSAVNIAASVLSASDLDEASLYRAYDAVHAALWPWYVDEAPGGTTLTTAIAGTEGVFVAAIGDSPAYADDDTGLAMVTEPGPGGALREWLGSRDVPQPTIRWWPAAQEVTRLIITSDGIAPTTIYGLASAGCATQGVAQALAVPSVGGDDATITVACLTWAPAALAETASVATSQAQDQCPGQRYRPR